MKVLFLLFSLFSFSAQAELNYGQFNDLQSSVITGDIGGIRLNLKKTKNKITGSIDIAAGDFTGERPLQKLRCDEAKGQCQFTYKEFNHTVTAQIDTIGKGYIMRFDDMEKRQHQTFLADANTVGSEKDVTTFAKGAFYADDKKTKQISVLAEDSPVVFENVVDQENNFLIQISHGNDKGYIASENFYQSFLAIIVEDCVFTDKPDGTSKQTLKRGTLLGLIKPINANWVKVSYQGNIGFVARKAIVGQVDMVLLEQVQEEQNLKTSH